MLYKLAHIFQDKLPFVWDVIEWVNSVLFRLRYGKKLKCITDILMKYSKIFQIREATVGDVDGLVEFFQKQPEESYNYFKPHSFDTKTIKKLINRKSYLFFIVLDDKKIIGYYFLRSFFMGKSYLGKIVDKNYRGKGVGKLMCLSAMDVAYMLGLHMYETISKDNLASLYSSRKVLDVKILKELDDNYIYVEDFPKGTLTKTVL